MENYIRWRAIIPCTEKSEAEPATKSNYSLISEKELLWKGRASTLAIIRYFLVGPLTALLVSLYFPPELSGLIGVGTFIGIVGINAITIMTSEYALTNDRTYIRYGFVPNRKIYDINNKKISAMFITQGIFGAMFNYGNIIVYAPDDYKDYVKLRDVRNPIKLKNILIESRVSQTKFSTFENSDLGIIIANPHNWSNQVRDDTVIFGPPEVNPSDALEDQVTKVCIFVENYSKENLEAYLDETIDSYRKDSKDFNLIECNTNFILSGFRAYKLVYTEKHPLYDVELKSLEVGVANNGRAYSIVYTSEIDYFAGYMPKLNKMIRSFRIPGQNTLS